MDQGAEREKGRRRESANERESERDIDREEERASSGVGGTTLVSNLSERVSNARPGSEDRSFPLSSEHGTHRTVRTRSQSLFSAESV